MNNFKRVGMFDIEPATHEVSQCNLWNWLNVRRMFPSSGHYDVDDIILRFYPLQERRITQQEVFDSNTTVSYFPWYMLREVKKLVLKHKPKGYTTGRVMISMLKPGGIISPHVDEGKYADNHERYHFVLHSNSNCTFICGEEAVQMRAGEIWTFNHKLEHQVINADRGNPRVHIIADYRKVEQHESNTA
jgi:hypothetical protein